MHPPQKKLLHDQVPKDQVAPVADLMSEEQFNVSTEEELQRQIKALKRTLFLFVKTIVSGMVQR